MIYGDNPVKWNEREADPNDPLGLNTYTYVPDITAILQSGNRYVYGMNNPVMYIDQNGNFVITTTVLLIAGGAALFGTIGSFIGNHIANQKGATGWEKVEYIAGGAAIGAVGGGTLGAVAAPAVATATGIGGISITASAGITVLPVITGGQAHHVISNQIANALSGHNSLSGMINRATSTVSAWTQQAHQGCQAWHRVIDSHMVNWLKSNPNATIKQFGQELYNQYATKENIQRFGEDILKYIKETFLK